MIIKSDNGYSGTLSSVKHFTNVHFCRRVPGELHLEEKPGSLSTKRATLSHHSPTTWSFGAPSCQKGRLGLGRWELMPSHHRNSAVSWGCPALSYSNKIGPNTESLSSLGLRLSQLLSTPHYSFKFQLLLTSKITANIYRALQSAFAY